MSVNSMPKENKMGTMPVKKLIFNMALPLIISMLIQALIISSIASSSPASVRMLSPPFRWSSPFRTS